MSRMPFRGITGTHIRSASGVRKVRINFGDLYVTGGFTTAGGFSADRISSWDGSVWAAPSSPPNEPKYAMCVYDGLLYISIGDSIYTWNGTSFSLLASFSVNQNVHQMLVYNNELIIIGDFTSINGVPYSYIAKWNGSAWSSLGTGIGSPADDINKCPMAIHNGKLIVSTNGTTYGGVSTYGIASWDGSSWSAYVTIPPPGPFGNYLNSTLLSYGGKLVMSCPVQTVNSVDVNRLMTWDGTSLASLGGGITAGAGRAYSMCHFRGGIAISGQFTQLGGSVSATNIVWWSGSSYSAMGSGINANNGPSMIQYRNDLVIAGTFTDAGGTGIPYLAKWDGTSWSGLGSGINNIGSYLCVYSR